ncbi:MAG: NDP-sugar synthase [Acidobacteria bacterium]|nr:MAG: NDP-sugar synthase [Acidobacteriota bacterium]
MKAIILAGGLSSGLVPLTINTPKPLLPIGNYPLILFQVNQLKKAGIKEIILSLSYQPRLIEEILKDGSNFGLILRYHVEATPLGTAGAFKVAEHLIDDTTLVLNGDVLSEMAFEVCLDTHRKRRGLVTIATCSVANPRSYGAVEVDQEGRVIGFVERPRGKAVRNNTINAGVYVLEPEVLQWIPRDRPFFFEKDLFPVLLERRVPFFARAVGEYWREITRPYSYLQSNMDFLDKRVSIPQFHGYQKENHPPGNPEVVVDDASLFDEQCMIKPGAQIVHSVIGSNCRIEEGAIVRNSVLWPGCRIQRNAFVSGSILGRGCTIGEGSLVYAGNILGDKSSLTSYCRT